MVSACRHSLLAALIAALFALAVPAVSGAEVRTATTEARSGELAKTLAISKQPWQNARALLRLEPERLGRVKPGDWLEAAYDLQVSVCIKATPGYPQRNCHGKVYGYDVNLKAQLLLTASGAPADLQGGVRIGATQNLLCTQKLTQRNHHCALQRGWQGARAPDALPCAGDCQLSLVVSAHHPQADGAGRHVVTVGATNDKGAIQQGKARLAAAVHLGGKQRHGKRWSTGKPRVGGVPIRPAGADVKKVVVISQKLSNLRKGDQLLARGTVRASVNRLPYDALQRAEFVLSDKPGSIKPVGKGIETSAQVGAGNGFNCTKRRSGHTSPCPATKAGVISVGKAVKGPVYLNLIAGFNAKGPSTWTRKWKSSHRAKIIGKGTAIEVRAFRGHSTCDRCSTGVISFSTGEAPAGRPGKLVSQLNGDGILWGKLECSLRGKPATYTCDWSSAGRYGSSRTYSCSSKAWWNETGQRFDYNACRDAFGAQLWRELQLLGERPTQTGPCEELSGGRFSCRWWTERACSSGPGYYKGTGIYSRSTREWRINPDC